MSKKKVKNLLPQHLFVRREEDGDDHYFCAFEGGCMEAVDDDGPTCVGIYKLIKIYPAVTKQVLVGEVVEACDDKN